MLLGFHLSHYLVCVVTDQVPAPDLPKREGSTTEDGKVQSPRRPLLRRFHTRTPFLPIPMPAAEEEAEAEEGGGGVEVIEEGEEPVWPSCPEGEVAQDASGFRLQKVTNLGLPPAEGQI